MSKQVETAIPFQVDRAMSPKLAGAFAQVLESSGVVDYFQAWDQLTSWWPQALWRPENTPLASLTRDCDSFHDAFLLGGFAAAATDRLGVVVSSDAIRRGPAELMQTMLTLAGATNGRAILLLGSGELKQAKPFGHKRSDGLQKLEDLLRIFNLLWECDGPVDFQGNVWNLDGAWLGTARPHKPKVWAMGGGPRFREIAAKYADGFSTSIPSAFSTPEQWSEEVQRMKKDVERNGRDPETFDFGIWVGGLLHEDPDVIDRALENPLTKWTSAIMGRLNQADWELEGLEPAFPRDWHYALKLLPARMTRQEADAVTARVPRKMVERTYVTGTPADAAAVYKDYVDAGATWVSVVDIMPILLPPEEAATAMSRSIEVCRLLKEMTTNATGNADMEAGRVVS